jgi:hypothetical protein
MKRISLVVALAAATCLLLPLGSSGAPTGDAAKAQKWLGTWDTDTGRLYFDQAYRKRSDCGACGNPYYWVLEGRWKRPEKGWTKLKGSVSDKELGSFQGEWDLSKSDYFSEFGEKGWALAYREGDKLHGAWKACPVTSPPGPKCAHGHWTHGEKDSGAWKIGFHFTQRGHPDDRSNFKSQIGGAGSVVFKSESDAKNKLGPAAHGSQVFFHLDEGTEALARLTIDLQNGELGEGNRRVTLGLDGRVKSTTNGYCQDADAELALQEGRGGVPDKIELDLKGQHCNQGFTWTSLDRSRVNVNINLPRETH